MSATKHPRARVGTAAWALPKAYRGEFPEGDSLLAMYSQRLSAVEINTSFYRDHKRTTYEKWASSVPADFRFSVKLSKVFTHEQKLGRGEKDLASNLSDIMGLGEKLGCLLLQLAPKHEFDLRVAREFFVELRKTYCGPLAFEPRHLSWEGLNARTLLAKHGVSRVIADPQPYFKTKLVDADFADLVYMRLHGSPVMYRSHYSDESLSTYAQELRAHMATGRETWCIFDNTTLGFATLNALKMNLLLE